MTPARPTERDYHAVIDERMDKARARELESWLEAEAARDERLASWKRGADALRAVYDPIVAETPPLFLSLAARASAATREEAARGREASVALHRGRPAQAPPKPRRNIRAMIFSFFAGVVFAILLPASVRQIVDPTQSSISSGVLRVIAQITAYIGRLLGLGV